MINRVKHFLQMATDPCYRTEHLLSLYLDGELSSSQSLDLEAHLNECRSCRAAQAILTATHQVLSTREQVQPPAYLSERLRQAIAIEATRPAPIKQATPWVTPRLALAGGSVAAALVFGIIIFHHTGVEPGGHVKSAPRQEVALRPSTSNSPTQSTNAPSKLPTIKRERHSDTQTVAALPQPEYTDIQPLHISVPKHEATITHQISMTVHQPSQRAEKIHSETSVHLNEPHNSSTGPLIAEVPPPSLPNPSTTGISSQPTLPQPTQQQPTAEITVADNTEQSNHGNLYGRLKSAMLTSQLETSVQLNTNQVRLASYSPQGQVQLQGSSIDGPSSDRDVH